MSVQTFNPTEGEALMRWARGEPQGDLDELLASPTTTVFFCLMVGFDLLAWSPSASLISPWLAVMSDSSLAERKEGLPEIESRSQEFSPTREILGTTEETEEIVLLPHADTLASDSPHLSNWALLTLLTTSLSSSSSSAEEARPTETQASIKDMRL